MKLSTSERAVLSAFKADPANRKTRYALNSLFWDLLYKYVRTQAEGGRAKALDLKGESDFFDFGFMGADLLENGDADWKEIKDSDTPVNDPSLFPFSSWIGREYELILNFDKKDHLKSELAAIEHEVKAKSEEVAVRQEDRRNLFLNNLDAALASRGMQNPAYRAQCQQRFDRIRQTDEMQYEILTTQKRIASGKFLDVQVKREQANRIQEHQKALLAFRNLVTELKNPPVEKEIMGLTEELTALMTEQVEAEHRQRRKRDELDALVNQTSRLSPQEVEASLNETLDYLKGLMILSSKRVKAEPLAVVTQKAKPVTRARLRKVLDMIEEFDPRVFKNDRVKYLGLPKFVILPGFGNSLYDWKNNAILVPTLPYTRLEESLFAGVVEYKLDMDEDKVLLMSYNKLEENKGIKSHLRLKEKFAKDYAIFMGQETHGYKVLPRDTRTWFNREIAPNRNEIKIPLRFDPVAMSQEDFVKLAKDLNEAAASGKATPDQWYGLGIIEHYNEASEKSIAAFKKAIEISPDFLDAIFNLAIVHLEKQMRREAAACFSDYIKKSPQNWWTSVCQEHLMKVR